MIVQYSYDNGRKVFDIDRALIDSGWGITEDNLLKTSGLKLADRNNPNHIVTISHIEHARFFNMYFVHFSEGGWLCLDNAINQFEIVN